MRQHVADQKASAGHQDPGGFRERRRRIRHVVQHQQQRRGIERPIGQGKRFELEVDGELTDERLAEVHEIAEKLLSNPVIEDFSVYVEEFADDEDDEQ